MKNKEKAAILKELITELEKKGATYVKADYFDFYFKIEIGSEMDNVEKLKELKQSLMRFSTAGLKIIKYKK